ncbi:MAG: DUF1801 domain-containing protein [Phycisphaerales bacterium]|jgi:hypothetical protein
MSSKPRSKKPVPKTKKTAKPKANARTVARRSRATGASPETSADWRSATLARVRELIVAALPSATEEIKWRKPSNGMQGVPVWSLGGIICTGETYKDYVKLTFAKGASMQDYGGLFNADDRGNTRRAINIREGDTLDAADFMRLVRDAALLNGMDTFPTDRYLAPGTKVRYDGADAGPEYGIVVHCWMDKEKRRHLCHVAFYGDRLPVGRPADTPYVLRYPSLALSDVD